MSPLYDGSNGDGWFSVFVIVPVIGLVIWGLNTFWLHRLKKGRYGLLAGGVPQKGPDLRHNIGSGASGSAAAGGPASLEPALTTLFPPQ